MKRQLEYDIRGSLPHTLDVPGYESLHIHHHSGALFSSTWQYVLQINADERTKYFTLGNTNTGQATEVSYAKAR